jgi:hypothetical protein
MKRTYLHAKEEKEKNPLRKLHEIKEKGRQANQ